MEILGALGAHVFAPWAAPWHLDSSRTSRSSTCRWWWLEGVIQVKFPRGLAPPQVMSVLKNAEEGGVTLTVTILSSVLGDADISGFGPFESHPDRTGPDGPDGRDTEVRCGHRGCFRWSGLAAAQWVHQSASGATVEVESCFPDGEIWSRVCDRLVWFRGEVTNDLYSRECSRAGMVWCSRAACRHMRAQARYAKDDARSSRCVVTSSRGRRSRFRAVRSGLCVGRPRCSCSCFVCRSSCPSKLPCSTSGWARLWVTTRVVRANWVTPRSSRSGYIYIYIYTRESKCAFFFVQTRSHKKSMHPAFFVKWTNFLEFLQILGLIGFYQYIFLGFCR